MSKNDKIFKKSEEERDKLYVNGSKKVENTYKSLFNEISTETNSFSKEDPTMYDKLLFNDWQVTVTKRTEQLANELYIEMIKDIDTMVETVIKDNASWVSSLFSLNLADIEAQLLKSKQSIVNDLINGTIYDSGWNLSGAIWGMNENTKAEIYRLIAEGYQNNLSTYDIAKLIESYVNPDKSQQWLGPDGLKIFHKKIDYNAQRLVRTLIQHSYQKSFVESTYLNPFVTKYIWIANGGRPCPICEDRDGQEFEKDDLPMDHPNGMCTMVPLIEDNYIDKLANWFNSPYGTYPDIDNFANSFGYYED